VNEDETARGRPDDAIPASSTWCYARLYHIFFADFFIRPLVSTVSPFLVQLTAFSSPLSFYSHVPIRSTHCFFVLPSLVSTFSFSLVPSLSLSLSLSLVQLTMLSHSVSSPDYTSTSLPRPPPEVHYIGLPVITTMNFDTIGLRYNRPTLDIGF